MRPTLWFPHLHRNVQHARFLSVAPAQVTRRRRLQVGGANYQEGDRVLASIRGSKGFKEQILPPLRKDATTTVGSHSHKIEHNSIIGKPADRLLLECESVSSKHSKTWLRISHPSLDQFIALAPREVTPIYSSYGATIVSLLDIHVSPPTPSNYPHRTKAPRFEILEAGTGNGALTLHLARAIAAANPPAPRFEEEPEQIEYQKAWGEWRATRRAVIHTIEFDYNRSRVAETLIKSFRGAMYWPHIDFHSGDVGAWAQSELQNRQDLSGKQKPFLDIVILDLPGVDQQIRHVCNAIKWHGRLLVWVPQVTQVAACQYQIAQLDSRLKLDQVIELGEGISTGRKWDLRVNVLTRAEQKKEQLNVENLEADSVPSSGDAETSSTAHGPDTSGRATDSAEFPKMVCRPKVGEYIMGGGFVGIWTKVLKE